jgi:hypothetical protein
VDWCLAQDCKLVGGRPTRAVSLHALCYPPASQALHGPHRQGAESVDVTCV